MNNWHPLSSYVVDKRINPNQMLDGRSYCVMRIFSEGKVVIADKFDGEEEYLSPNVFQYSINSLSDFCHIMETYYGITIDESQTTMEIYKKVTESECAHLILATLNNINFLDTETQNKLFASACYANWIEEEIDLLISVAKKIALTANNKKLFAQAVAKYGSVEQLQEFMKEIPENEKNDVINCMFNAVCKQNDMCVANFATAFPDLSNNKIFKLIELAKKSVNKSVPRDWYGNKKYEQYDIMISFIKGRSDLSQETINEFAKSLSNIDAIKAFLQALKDLKENKGIRYTLPDGIMRRYVNYLIDCVAEGQDSKYWGWGIDDFLEITSPLSNNAKAYLKKLFLGLVELRLKQLKSFCSKKEEIEETINTIVWWLNKQNLQSGLINQRLIAQMIWENKLGRYVNAIMDAMAHQQIKTDKNTNSLFLKAIIETGNVEAVVKFVGKKELDEKTIDELSSCLVGLEDINYQIEQINKLILTQTLSNQSKNIIAEAIGKLLLNEDDKYYCDMYSCPTGLKERFLKYHQPLPQKAKEYLAISEPKKKTKKSNEDLLF